MPQSVYETFREVSPLGIKFAWHTNSGGHHPLHWHNEMELLYPLNGKADIVIEGEKHPLLKRHLLVVESEKVHSTHDYEGASMFLCIHIDKEKLDAYFPGFSLLQIACIPDQVPDEKFEQYLGICRLLDELSRLYVLETPSFNLEAHGIILQAAAHLAEYFSLPVTEEVKESDTLTKERIREVIQYVEQHFREPVSLADVSGLLGLGKEYFCRFFKKNMGISFLQYLNEIRLAHVYYDLVHTDLPVSEIMEANGLTNQKLFNRTFRELYGCTPSSVRKGKQAAPASHAD